MTPAKSRIRKKKQQNFDQWLSQLDRQVEDATREIRQTTSFADLEPGQRLLFDFLLNLMRKLPRLREGEYPHDRKEYYPLFAVLLHVFLWQYPEWRNMGDKMQLCDLPPDAYKLFQRMYAEAAGPKLPRVIKSDD